MPPVEVQQFPVAKGQIEAQRRDLFQPQGGFARVCYAYSAGDDVQRLIDTVKQFHFRAGGGVGEGDGERLRLTVPGEGRGQSAERILARADLVPDIAQIRAVNALRRHRQNRAQAVVAVLRAAVLLHLRIQRPFPLIAQLIGVG